MTLYFSMRGFAFLFFATSFLFAEPVEKAAKYHELLLNADNETLMKRRWATERCAGRVDIFWAVWSLMQRITSRAVASTGELRTVVTGSWTWSFEKMPVGHEVETVPRIFQPWEDLHWIYSKQSRASRRNQSEVKESTQLWIKTIWNQLSASLKCRCPKIPPKENGIAISTGST